MQINELDQQTLTRLHGEYLADDKGVRTTSATQLQEDAYALGYQRAAAKDDEQAAFEDWIARALPSGDCSSVQDQWLASSDCADFHASTQPATGIHSADPLACSGCVSGCLRCSVDAPANKARALLAKVMQNHVTALPLAIRAEIEAVIG